VKNCLPESALKELGDSMLQDFDRRVADTPSTLCAPFNAEGARLEVELLAIYKMVALCVREEQDLTAIAKYWETMVKVCDEFAGRLNRLSEQHPNCGAEFYYDRVLDLRNKCQRLQTMHS
jgi:hypothetical protein